MVPVLHSGMPSYVVCVFWWLEEEEEEEEGEKGDLRKRYCCTTETK